MYLLNLLCKICTINLPVTKMSILKIIDNSPYLHIVLQKIEITNLMFIVLESFLQIVYIDRFILTTKCFKSPCQLIIIGPIITD